MAGNLRLSFELHELTRVRRTMVEHQANLNALGQVACGQVFIVGMQELIARWLSDCDERVRQLELLISPVQAEAETQA